MKILNCLFLASYRDRILQFKAYCHKDSLFKDKVKPIPFLKKIYVRTEAAAAGRRYSESPPPRMRRVAPPRSPSPRNR